jgi:hypothetical protein
LKTPNPPDDDLLSQPRSRQRKEPQTIVSVVVDVVVVFVVVLGVGLLALDLALFHFVCFAYFVVQTSSLLSDGPAPRAKPVPKRANKCRKGPSSGMTDQ